MTTPEEVKEQLLSVTEEAAKKLNLKNYSIDLNLTALTGDGFLGEFYKTSVTNKDDGTIHYFAIKKALTSPARRKENNIHGVYVNEVCFYDEIYPTFRKFEEENQVKEPFCEIPGFITGSTEDEKEIIVFRDITKEGFVLRDKTLLLDDEHVKLIFRTYGHFHAISFCLKKLKPKEYNSLAEKLTDIWREFGTKRSFLEYLKNILELSVKSLDVDKDAKIIEKAQKYAKDTEKVYNDNCVYKGEHFCFLHGDCWSNNMMFKYKDSESSELEAIKLLDFQLIHGTGTPVFDLSYFFYTGGSKQLFDNLQFYLDIYYESFTESCQNLGCDAKALFPREQLTKDWKTYSKFGMMLALMLTKIKLINKQQTAEMIDKMNSGEEDPEKYLSIGYDEKLFKLRARDILVHMHEIDVL